MAQVQVSGGGYEADALLIDKDGTLVDVSALWGPWAQLLVAETAARLGGEVGAEALRRGLGLELDDDAVVCDPSGPLAAGSLEETRIALAASAYRAGIGWPRARAAVDAAEEAADRQFARAEHVRLRRGALALLDGAAAAGVACALVTADDRAGALADLRAAGVSERFAAVVGGDDVSRGKPAPDGLLVACDALGVSPERAVVIGDTDNDVRAARAAGCAAVIGSADDGVPTEHLAGADHVVRDLSDVRVAAAGRAER